MCIGFPATPYARYAKTAAIKHKGAKTNPTIANSEGVGSKTGNQCADGRTIQSNIAISTASTVVNFNSALSEN